jgi:hypothetical protein
MRCMICGGKNEKHNESCPESGVSDPIITNSDILFEHMEEIERLQERISLLEKVAETYREYNNLLQAELSEMFSIAHTYGYRSSRIVKGQIARAKIIEAEQAVGYPKYKEDHKHQGYYQSNIEESRYLPIPEMIAEWRKGCSCSAGGEPYDCKECTKGLIEAIDNSVRDQ